MAATPLWDGSNDTLFSSVFVVPPGWSVVVFATGLLSEKVRRSAAEFKGPQLLCVERLVFRCDAPKVSAPQCDGCCSYVLGAMPIAELDSAELVETCFLPWVLEPCRNIGAIGIPGTYRLRLNDATAIGAVQAYAEWYEHGAIAPQAYGLFFS